MSDRYPSNVAAWCSFLCAASFVVCAALMAGGVFEPLDAWAAVAFGHMRSQWFTTLCKLITECGAYPFVISVCIASIVIPAIMSRKLVLSVALTALVSHLLNTAMKNVFVRPRPDRLLALVAEHGYSFPSGHAMTSMALWVAMGLAFGASKPAKRVLLALGVTFAVIIGLTRICLGVHYASDVLSGWLLGCSVACLVMAIRKWRGTDAPLRRE